MQKKIDTFFNAIAAFFSSSRNQQLLLLLLLLAGTVIRFWKIEYVPMANDADELAYIYAGQALYAYGEPISWSSFTYDDNTWQEMDVDSSTVNKQSRETFVRPWSDHPLLLPVITGSLSVAAGYTFPSIPPALLFRLPMLLFAVGTLYLVFRVTRHLLGYWPALFATALVAGSSALALIQRMVVGENVVIFCVLLALFLYLEKKNLVWAGVVAVLAIHAKVIGIIVVPIIALALALENKWKQAVVFGVITTVCAVGSLVAVGMSLSGESYIEALQNQSFRLLGWSNAASNLAKPGFQNYEFLDFSYYALLILGFTGPFLSKKAYSKKLVAGVILAFVALVWMTSAEQSWLGWYKIPLFVTLGIGSAFWIAEKKYLLPLVLISISLVNNLGLVRYPASPLPTTELLRGVVVLLFVGVFAALIWLQKQKYQAVALGLVICVYLAQALFVSHKFFEARCSDTSSCAVPLVTVRSILQ